ncbi:MAG: hypothetical protein GY792_35045 [Gammaproteobacteria bacterium]|nr:hypothetical protein [Gammaproteobacteria bacterium]
MHSEIEKLVITLLVMRSFSVLLGAPKACLDFREPTAVFRLKDLTPRISGRQKWSDLERSGKSRSFWLSGAAPWTEPLRGEKQQRPLNSKM